MDPPKGVTFPFPPQKMNPKSANAEAGQGFGYLDPRTTKSHFHGSIRSLERGRRFPSAGIWRKMLHKYSDRLKTGQKRQNTTFSCQNQNKKESMILSKISLQLRQTLQASCCRACLKSYSMPIVRSNLLCIGRAEDVFFRSRSKRVRKCIEPFSP